MENLMYSKVVVKKSKIWFLLSSKHRKFAGKKGTVVMEHVGEFSGKMFYAVLFNEHGQTDTGVFLAKEIGLVKSL